MKKTSILVKLVLVLVFVIFSQNCSSASTSTPESTVKLYFSSLNDNDVDSMSSCLIPEVRAEMLASYEVSPEGIGNITYVNVKTNLISMDDDKAEVYVEFDLRIYIMGEAMTDYEAATAQLEKRGTEWLIADFDKVHQ